MEPGVCVCMCGDTGEDRGATGGRSEPGLCVHVVGNPGGTSEGVLSLLVNTPGSPGTAAGTARWSSAHQGLPAGGRRGPALRCLLGPDPAVPGAPSSGSRGGVASSQLRRLRAQDLGSLHVLQQLGAQSAALRLLGLTLQTGLLPSVPLWPATPAPVPRVCTLRPSCNPHRAAQSGRAPRQRRQDAPAWKPFSALAVRFARSNCSTLSQPLRDKPGRIPLLKA